jgi:hypothetical protein
MKLNISSKQKYLVTFKVNLDKVILREYYAIAIRTLRGGGRAKG